MSAPGNYLLTEKAASGGLPVAYTGVVGDRFEKICAIFNDTAITNGDAKVGGHTHSNQTASTDGNSSGQNYTWGYVGVLANSAMVRDDDARIDDDPIFQNRVRPDNGPGMNLNASS